MKTHLKLLAAVTGGPVTGVTGSATADPSIRRRASAYAASRSSSVLVGLATAGLSRIKQNYVLKQSTNIKSTMGYLLIEDNCYFHNPVH